MSPLVSAWLTCLACALLSWPAQATAPAPVAGVPMPAPWSPGDAFDEHWGTRVPDPYRALENVRDPEVQRWLRAQADAAGAVLARIPGRDALLARLVEIDAQAGGVVSAITRADNGRLFFLRREPGEQQFSLVLRESAGADPARDRVLIDPDALSRAAGRPVAILSYAPSPDGRRLAYVLQTGGGEIGALQVAEVDAAAGGSGLGRVLAGPIDRVRFGEPVWLPDGSGLFYSRLREGYEGLPATQRFQDATRNLLVLGGEDRVIFSPSRFPELGLPPIANAVTRLLPGGRQVLAQVSLGVSRNRVVLLADLAGVREGRPQWRLVAGPADEVQDVAVGPGVLYLRSAKGAPRFQLLRLKLDEPDLARAEVWLPQGTGVLEGVAGARDALYFTRREGTTTRLFKLAHGSRDAQPMALPQAGHVDIVEADEAHDGVLARASSWTRASTHFAVGADGRAQALQLARAGAFDAPPNLMAREVLVKSHDGVEVPVSILSRADLKLDGRNPTLLYGYGAYGITETPGFNPRLLAWLEQGGVYAIAHVRGGGVFGRSAGGIFVGRAATERPDLFAAAISSVGVLDTVRSETRANGVANVPEYGTVAREDEFRALLAMSSYHALTPGRRYPAFLLTHGANDIRVDVWQSAKFAARLQALPSQEKPVLLRLDYDAGHGSGSSRAQSQARQADVWAFVLWQAGVPAFQPAKP